VGSRRILETCRYNSEKLSNKVDFVEDKTIVRRENGVVNGKTIKPLQPEEILRRMQDNPQSANLLIKASSDPDIMEAVRIAMNGSPKDLLDAAKNNPVIAEFLEDLWSALYGENGEEDRVPDTKTEVSHQSGLSTIRNSFQDTISQWDEETAGDFASGLYEQLDVLSLTSSPSQDDQTLYTQLIAVVKEELEASMKPEFLNRIDEIVVFSPLSGSDLALIAGLIVDKIITRASQEHTMQLTVTSDLVDKIVREGSTSADEFGARPMRRAAQRFVEDSLSDAIIQGFLKSGDVATISLAPPHLDGKDRVVIVSSDGNRFEVEIEGSTSDRSLPAALGDGKSLHQISLTETHLRQLSYNETLSITEQATIVDKKYVVY
jgi:hypothetical protein